MKNYTIHISLVTPDGEEHEHSDYLRFASGRDATARARAWAREVAREIGAKVVDAYAYDDDGVVV
jgi:hypothetical protein